MTYFIQVAGGEFTFRNSSLLGVSSDDHLTLVCSVACVVICEDERKQRNVGGGSNIGIETGDPLWLPVNSKWLQGSESSRFQTFCAHISI
jgi:hypothetical protein